MKVSLLLLLGGLLNGAAAEESFSDWVEVYPETYEQIESFYLAHDCKPYQNHGAIYDIDEARFLSFEEIAVFLPAQKEHFSPDQCEMKVAPDELTNVWSYAKALPAQGRIVVFYDISVNSKGESMLQKLPFSEEFKALYHERVDVLSSITSLPKYRVITPSSLSGG
ncbi:hypothetical protein [Pseudidiomarina sediminum]|uniref:hypothetical protein n=1 Tax=Pseudidiomarina sediminum TaxID=431675 RepID=UPI001C97A6AA|nr:hypothetical protein [Pseudidiomarina sediminum]MBY6064123.1 hypothetical protein [Pseudidiomarina sediminum]